MYFLFQGIGLKYKGYYICVSLMMKILRLVCVLSFVLIIPNCLIDKIFENVIK